jgi:uncharacterized integral membrane protein
MSKTRRTLIIIAAVVAGALIAASVIGCAHYEPPGRDLWRAL